MNGLELANAIVGISMTTDTAAKGSLRPAESTAHSRTTRTRASTKIPIQPKLANPSAT